MRLPVLLAVSVCIGACADTTDDTGSTTDAGQTTADASVSGTVDARVGGTPDAATLVTLKKCTGRSFTPGTKEEWNHSIVSAGIALASQQHSVNDVISTSLTGNMVTAKIVYGVLFVDLEDEKIRLYMDDCSSWKLMTTQVSDVDGKVSFTFPSLAYGIYDIKWEVAGDLTSVPGRLWVLPRNTHVAVHGVDGTLTNSDAELFADIYEEILAGDYVPELYDGAVDLTKNFATAGYVNVYLTGRPYWLTNLTRKWFAEAGFGAGALIFASSNTEALPSESGVGNYKKAKLAALKNAGFILDFAHGNATTDIYAYLGAGLAAGITYIIGEHAGEQGTVAVQGAGDWADRAAAVKVLPRPAQPFNP